MSYLPKMLESYGYSKKTEWALLAQHRFFLLAGHSIVGWLCIIKLAFYAYIDPTSTYSLGYSKYNVPA